MLLHVILVPNVATDPAEVADALFSLTSVSLFRLAWTEPSPLLTRVIACLQCMYCLDADTTHYLENECMREAMEEMLYENGVDVVLNGHLHEYERTNPVFVSYLSSLIAYRYVFLNPQLAHCYFLTCAMCMCSKSDMQHQLAESDSSGTRASLQKCGMHDGQSGGRD